MPQLKNFAMNLFMQNMIIYGPTGTGKTCSVHCLTRRLIPKELYNDAVLELNTSEDRGIGIVSTKIKSFAHSEFNKTKFTSINQISEKINSHKDLFGRDFKFEVIKDEELPNYIIENREKFSDFLA